MATALLGGLGSYAKAKLRTVYLQFDFDRHHSLPDGGEDLLGSAILNAFEKLCLRRTQRLRIKLDGAHRA